ncbi:MAG TPA: extracellular metalloproteinase, partial [Candidatus Limnocylindria bacterium]|nr:extracellular metalloproteinase [Candidatus Limnocylindria bacterium]
MARQFCFALVAALLWPCLALHADERAAHSSFTNFDKRVFSKARKAARPEQQAAQAVLKERAPNASADFDPLLGSPKWVHAQGGFLTEAEGEGRAVTRNGTKNFGKDPDKAVKAFLHEHREMFRHGPEILDGARKKRDHTNQFGARTVAWEQEVDGIPVFDSVFVANTTARGELVSVSSLFVPAPEVAAERGTPQRALKVRAPSWNAERALRAAAANLGEEVSEVTAIEGKPAPRTLKQDFMVKPLPGEASASLVWLPLDGETLRLCWDVELTRREFSERFRLLVDAETGEMLVRRKLTVDVSEVLYRVFTSDSPSPLSPGHPSPTNIQPPLVPRHLLAISNVNATASPLGWLSDAIFETRGNNVDARLDRDGDDRADLPRVLATNTVNGTRIFDFPIDFTQGPATYSTAATVQLFYWANWMHDKLYDLGFTESAGNFQKDNFGRGGADNDAMLADAQDGSGVNNANFTPGRDGSPGRIQMFTFTGSTPGRDGDFDAEVVLHEYAHGLTDRMVGGGVGLDFFGRLQCGGLGEGWSDFYALSLLSEFGDDIGANYAMSGYVTYQFSGLVQNYYYGIRRYPYTTNMNADPLTFKDIDASTASAHPGIPRSPIITSTGNEVHRQGEIWCSMLWDMRAFLLNKYAPTNAVQFDEANTRILRYVTEGLSQSPPNPNFAQARDGILKAIMLTGGGSDTNEAWRAFARRGLGQSAVCPDSSVTFGVVEGYDAPKGPDFDVQPNQVFLFSGVLGGPFENIAVTNTLVNSTTGNLAWAASVSFPSATTPWLRLLETNGVLALNAAHTNIAVVTTAANSLPAANYQATIFFTNVTSPTQVVSRLVVLSVFSPQNDPLVITPPTTYL